MRALTDRRLMAVLAVAVLARVLVIVATPGFIARNDAWDFDRDAISLVEHGSFPVSFAAPGHSATALRPPLWPLALAGAYELTGARAIETRWAVGRSLEVVLGVLTVALIYLIALEAWNRRVALTAAAIAAVYPPLLLVGSSLLSESLFIAMMLAAVWAALRARRSARPVLWALAVGAFLGLATMTRANGLALVVPLGFLLWSAQPRLRPRSLAAPLAMVGVMLVAMIPWTVRNENVFHRFLPLGTQAGFTLAGAYGPQTSGGEQFPYAWVPPAKQMEQAYVAQPKGDEADVAARLQSRALSYAENHPGLVAKVVGWNALRLLNLPGPGLERWGAPFESYPRGLAVASVYAFWVLGLLALIGAFSALARRVPAALWGVPAVIALSVLPFISDTQLRSPIDPFLVMLAALAVDRAWGTRAKRSAE